LAYYGQEGFQDITSSGTEVQHADNYGNHPGLSYLSPELSDAASQQLNVSNGSAPAQSKLYEATGTSVDGLGAISNDVEDPEDSRSERVGYFGASSTLSFVKQVHAILKGRDPGGGETNRDQYRRISTTPTGGLHWSGQYAEDYSIPTRLESDLMLTVFWDRIYPLYPFLDREVFDHLYAELWAGERGPETFERAPRPNKGHHSGQRARGSPRNGDGIPSSRIFHVLLNAMYALGCSSDRSKTSSASIRPGDFYWKRCKQVLERDFDVFNIPNLMFVQALLYICIYLQSTQDLTSACWNMVGVAVRMSQTLGLHTMSLQKADPQRSVRWLTWAGCVVMDR
jgi:hypothetical protein